MAEIPDVNPLRPIWPTRPDERGRGRREQEKDDTKERHPQSEPQPHHRKPDADDDHQIDEYV